MGLDMKKAVKELLGPKMIRRIKGAFGTLPFDEVSLVHHLIADRPGIMIDVGAH